MGNVSLHDCRINQMRYENKVLSFYFYDGIYVSDKTVEEFVRTGKVRMDCYIIDEFIDGISIYIFDKKTNEKSIREDWTDNFISAINDGSFEFEFVTTYKSYQHILFKGYIWFDKKPYCKECEIELHTDKITFLDEPSKEEIAAWHFSKGMSNNVDRIFKMEQNFDIVSMVLKHNPKSINNSLIRNMIDELKEYYDSDRWLRDYEADERGELPKDLKRGVLSQDGLYNLFNEIREINVEEDKKMNHDLCVKMDDGILNIRVGAIIMKEDKFLMVENDRFDHMYSVGGRIKFGETAEEAVVREVFEETGVKMEIDRLGFIHENFFPGDTEVKKGNIVHEISFFFYMKVPVDFEPICNSFTEDGNKEHLVWIRADHKKKYYPEFFKTELNNPVMEVKHFVTRNV